MFDVARDLLQRAREAFANNVHDAFGTAIVGNQLDPLCADAELLQSLHEDFQRESRLIGELLDQARALSLEGGA